MEFRTQLPKQKQNDNLIDYHSKIIFLGSCFSENIGAKFQDFNFQNVINPFGILFHPKAIESVIERIVNQNFYSHKELIFNNEQFHCFEAHSSLSNSNKEMMLNSLNEIIETSLTQINEASHLVITFGTSWVYEYIDLNKIVANCHKLPQIKFIKKILSVQEIIDSLRTIEVLLNKINPSIKIIYTVSPVRHIKDGFIQNQQSKSNLLSAIHSYLPKSNSSYFPSYEIMLDDLRDYRFYKADMLHPNKVAVNYIWEYFMKTWLCESTFPIMKKVAKIKSGMSHKPFNPSSKAHVIFLSKLEEQKQNLLKEYPKMLF